MAPQPCVTRCRSNPRKHTVIRPFASDVRPDPISTCRNAQCWTKSTLSWPFTPRHSTLCWSGTSGSVKIHAVCLLFPSIPPSIGPAFVVPIFWQGHLVSSRNDCQFSSDPLPDDFMTTHTTTPYLCDTRSSLCAFHLDSQALPYPGPNYSLYSALCSYPIPHHKAVCSASFLLSPSIFLPFSIYP